jgi:hypothetical protein
MGWIPAKALITMVFPSLFFFFSPENSNIRLSLMQSKRKQIEDSSRKLLNVVRLILNATWYTK